MKMRERGMNIPLSLIFLMQLQWRGMDTAYIEVVVKIDSLSSVKDGGENHEKQGHL